MAVRPTVEPLDSDTHAGRPEPLTKRRLMPQLRERLAGLAPDVASMVGLPERSFILDWAPRGTRSAAYTDAEHGLIRVSYSWFAAHPDDDGCLAHEYTHLVQNVPGGTCPGDVIEGFADSVRYKLRLYDPAWWTPSEMASRIARLSSADYRLLSQAMAAGRYSSFVWPPT
jgi:hypothetical protein